MSEEELMMLSDDEKIKLLETFNNEQIKAAIIKLLQSEEKKLEELEKIIDEFAKVSIIKTLQSDEKKIEALRKLTDEFAKAIVIETLQSDKQKIEELVKLSDNYCKEYIITSLEDDDEKINLLEHLSSDQYKISVIKELKDENNKIKALRQLSSDYSRYKVIRELDGDDKKIEAIEQLSNENVKAEVIKLLEDDEKKIKELRKLNDEYIKADIISTLKKDDKKIEELKQFTDDVAKIFIITSLQDKNKQLEELRKLTDEFAKVEVISELQDDNIKIKELESISDSFFKAIVIMTLQDDYIKIRELRKLDNDLAKASIIVTLQNKFKKIEELGNLNDEIAKLMVIHILQNNKKNVFNDRSKLKELLLEENRKYIEIGLDPKMTIGMEIESEGAIGIHLQKIKEIIVKQIGENKLVWEAKEEGSLLEGVEIVSPILIDSKEDVEDIYIICSLLKKCGNFTSERCGGHIHIGADYLKCKEAYINLFEILGNAEEIIYKISNEEGIIPREGLQEYASTISPKLNKAIENGSINLENEEDLDEFISEIQDIQGDRYSSLNLLNINNGKNTIEFRIPNGTINPDTWIENARLYGRIVEMSQRLAEIEKQTEYSQEDIRLIELRDKLKEDIPEQEKMENLLELLFTEEERQVYRERYNASSKILEQLPEEKNPLRKTKFGKVDFKKKHSLTEFQEVAIKDRIENANEATMETVQGVRTEGKSEKSNEFLNLK